MKPGPKPVRPCEAFVVLVNGQQCVSVPLTKGLFALVDLGDAEAVLQYAWQAKTSKNHSLCYATKRGGPFMHQFVLGRNWVDHRNGNGLDNRRCNLRMATPSQNQANAKLRKDSGTGFKGVSWRPPKGNRRGRWVVRLGRNGDRLQLGSFQTLEAAVRVYNAAALEQWGHFARINPIPSQTLSGPLTTPEPEHKGHKT